MILEMTGNFDMSRRAETLCVITLLALVTTPRAGALAQEMPSKAVVIRNNTPIRAGAGRSFYIVGELSQGAQVTVEEVVFGWYKIQPPEGTFSYISRAFVDAFGDGQAGRINTNRAAVRTASINGPGESYRRQIDLLKGDTVQIVSEQGSFYKIIPPDGAYVFLPPGTVRDAALSTHTPTDTADPHLQQTPRAETPASLSNSWPTPSRAEAPDEISAAPTPSNLARTNDPPTTARELTRPLDASNENVAPPPVQGKAEPVLEALITAERRFQETHTLPLEDQPIAQLLSRYQALAKEVKLESTDRHIIAVRIAELQHRMEVADALRQIAAARKNIQSDLIHEILNDERLAPPKQQYDARGLLQASGVYNGNALPQLFRVVEPANNRIITYIRLRPEVDPSVYVGKYVGIAGQTVFDPALKLKLIEAEYLEVIELSATR